MVQLVGPVLQPHSPLDFDVEPCVWVKGLQELLQSGEGLVVVKILVKESGILRFCLRQVVYLQMG